MLVKLHIHSAFDSMFSYKQYEIDLVYYQDILEYLRSIHKPFVRYIIDQNNNGNKEGYVFLDKNLNILDLETFKMRRVKDGDEFYLVPALYGGEAITASIVAGFNAITSGIGSLWATLGPTIKTLAVNLALGFLAAAFQPKKKEQEKSRQNDLYGSLNNTTTNGTPIPITYGMVRVAGQLLSGYINTIDHDKNETTDSMGIVYVDS